MIGTSWKTPTAKLITQEGMTPFSANLKQIVSFQINSHWVLFNTGQNRCKPPNGSFSHGKKYPTTSIDVLLPFRKQAPAFLIFKCKPTPSLKTTALFEAPPPTASQVRHLLRWRRLSANRQMVAPLCNTLVAPLCSGVTTALSNGGATLQLSPTAGTAQRGALYLISFVFLHVFVFACESVCCVCQHTNPTASSLGEESFPTNQPKEPRSLENRVNVVSNCQAL